MADMFHALTINDVQGEFLAEAVLQHLETAAGVSPHSLQQTDSGYKSCQLQLQLPWINRSKTAYAGVCWGARDERMCDADALSLPNVELARW